MIKNEMGNQNPETVSESKLSVLLVNITEATEITDHLENLDVTVQKYEEDQEIPGTLNYDLLKRALNSAKNQHIDLIMSVDPIGKRLSLAALTEPDGEFRILNFNQLAAIITELAIRENEDPEAELFKSFRVTELIDKIANKHHVKCNAIYQSLSKNIDEINQVNLLMHFTDNQEYYLKNEHGILNIIDLIIAEVASLKNEGKTLYETLTKLYLSHGFFKEKSLTVQLNGKSQLKHYGRLIDKLRTSNSESIKNNSIKIVTDFKKQKSKNLLSGKVTKLDNDLFNGVLVSMTNGSTIAVELSDNKLNYNISVRGSFSAKDQINEIDKSCNKEIIKLIDKVNAILL